MTKRTATRRTGYRRGGVLVAAAFALTLGLTACGGDESDGDASNTEESAATEPMESESADAGSAAAADAPTDADPKEFCDSFDMSALSKLGSGGNLDALREIQDTMVGTGTPADMNEGARRGWEWFVSIDGDQAAQGMNQDDMTALATYYAKTCAMG